MNALALLHELHQAGIWTERRGEKLVLKPADRVTTEIVNRVREVKPELLRVIDPARQRNRLLEAARQEGINRYVVDQLTDADLAGIECWSDVQLRVAIRWYRDDPPYLRKPKP